VTSKAREREAERATLAFQLALSQVGVSTIEDALKMWQDVPAASRSAASEKWLARAIELVMTRRTLSRELARGYYRLVRALLTGKTTPDPAHPEPEYITLGELRRQFGMLTGEAEETPSKAARDPQAVSSTAGPSWGQSVEPVPSDEDAERDDDNDRILIEELERIEADADASDAAAEQELETILQALGPDNLDKKLDELDDTLPAQEVDKLREEAHLQAGSRAAAGAARVAMNGGRSELWDSINKDKRALAWARYSTTGTPCGWCAMLISRGPVYKSQASAEFSDGDLYHDNCHCAAIPVFSAQQYETSDTFALNRQYSEEWPRVTRGLSGKAALTAWRRYIRTQYKTPAQAAG